jgi:malonyl CoA-acyl carrier protein transacylase
VEEPDEIRRLLVTQVTGMVRWRESVIAMSDAGVTHFVEWGAKVLGGMVKRIAPDAPRHQRHHPRRHRRFARRDLGEEGCSICLE